MASRNVAALRLYRSILTTHRRVLPTAVSGWAAGAQGILSHTRQPVGLSLAGWLAGCLSCAWLSVDLSVYPSVRLSTCPCVCASVRPAVRLSGWLAGMASLRACLVCHSVSAVRWTGGLAVYLARRVHFLDSITSHCHRDRWCCRRCVPVCRSTGNSGMSTSRRSFARIGQPSLSKSTCSCRSGENIT